MRRGRDGKHDESVDFFLANFVQSIWFRGLTVMTPDPQSGNCEFKSHRNHYTTGSFNGKTFGSDPNDWVSDSLSRCLCLFLFGERCLGRLG